MSPFEIVMLVCFGAAWPFSIYKSYRSKEVAGKSLLFLIVIFIGYVAGTVHKIFYLFDYVIILYILNGLMVLIDILLYFRNRLYHVRSSLRDAEQSDRGPVSDSREKADTGQTGKPPGESRGRPGR